MSDNLEMFPDMPRNLTRLEAWKDQYGVKTVRSDMGDQGQDWLAIFMTKACEVLSGYELTQDEKEDPWSLLYGYCRLLNEAGLSQTGDTELEACQKIAARWQLIGI